jgi:amino acid permease
MAARRAIAAIVVIIGVVAVIVGVIYFVVPAGSLPSFIPGHLAGVTNKHTNRGMAGIVVGVVLVVLALVLGRGSRSPYPR